MLRPFSLECGSSPPLRSPGVGDRTEIHSFAWCEIAPRGKAGARLRALQGSCVAVCGAFSPPWSLGVAGRIGFHSRTSCEAAPQGKSGSCAPRTSESAYLPPPEGCNNCSILEASSERPLTSFATIRVPKSPEVRRLEFNPPTRSSMPPKKERLLAR